MDSLVIRVPDDWHVHLRDGDMLNSVAQHTACLFKRALIMPNLTPPVLTGADAVAYRQRIVAATHGTGFEPLMTIKLIGSTTPEIVYAARTAGVVAGKLYPEGVTTNSEDGVREFCDLLPVFEAMAECGMVLCVHAEQPNAFVMTRERSYLKNIYWVAQKLPRLRVVIEHATTAEALNVARGFDNVACSITVHHLMLTLDDVVGGMLNPHHFCKPIAKTPEDREALIAAATSGDPRFFLGTDSAPHHRSKKECASGCAGVFTAPVALELLAEIFDKYGVLDRLNDFTSVHGARYYGLPLNEGEVLLRRASVTEVPEIMDGVVPFQAGRLLPWAAERLR